MNIVFGASGHAKEIEFLLRCFQKNITIIDFFVAHETHSYEKNIPIISELDLVKKIANYTNSINAFVAIGNNGIRKKIVEKFIDRENIVYPNLIFDSIIGDFDNIKLGSGNVFFPSVVLTTDISIGNHNHFNLNSSVSHDCMIGDYNTFSPGVVIAGGVTIGDNNFFGSGVCVIDKVNIIDNITIGAGAVVTGDLKVPGTYVGVPARRIK